jgi:D-xylose transport system substrate-binding protein
LLLPEHTTARYETQDRPHFESMVKSLCPNCSVVYQNANQDASEQQSQADSVLTQDAELAGIMDLLALQSSVKFMVTGGVLGAAVIVDALARRNRQVGL